MWLMALGQVPSHLDKSTQILDKPFIIKVPSAKNSLLRGSGGGVGLSSSAGPKNASVWAYFAVLMKICG